MKIFSRSWWLGLMILLLNASLTHAAATRVFVKAIDENGQIIPNVLLYIEGAAGTRFRGGKEIKGTDTMALKPGQYQLTASYSKQEGDHVARYSSPVASINLKEGDTESVVLRLSPVEDDIPVLTSYYEMNLIAANTLHNASY